MADLSLDVLYLFGWEVSQDKRVFRGAAFVPVHPGNSDSGLYLRREGRPDILVMLKGLLNRTCLTTTVTQHQLTVTSSDPCAFCWCFHGQVLIRCVFENGITVSFTYQKSLSHMRRWNIVKERIIWHRQNSA